MKQDGNRLVLTIIGAIKRREVTLDVSLPPFSPHIP